MLLAFPFDVFTGLLGPGLIFLALCFWLVRKVVKAARTESDLEQERLSGALGEELMALKARAAASQGGAAKDARAAAAHGDAAEDARAGATQGDAAEDARAGATQGDAGEDARGAQGHAGAGAPARAAQVPKALQLVPLPEPRDDRPPLSAAQLASDAVQSALLAASTARFSQRVPGQLQGADVGDASPAHLEIVAALIAERERAVASPRGAPRVEVLWVRSASEHVAWAERRLPIAPATLVRTVICVAQLQDGKVVARWQFS